MQRQKQPTRTRSIKKQNDRMARFKSLILLIVLTVSVGGSAIERPVEPEPNGPEQKEEQKSFSVPAFRYRPSAGLMIEGRRHDRAHEPIGTAPKLGSPSIFSS